MNAPRALLGCLLSLAAAAWLQAQAPGSAIRGRHPPAAPDTHGVDLRTQSGPPMPNGVRYSPPFPLDPNLPTLWLIGDSTVRNGSAGDGTNLNQWGWGAPLTFYFDPHKVNVVNRALGGTSARSFYNNNWKRMVDLIKPGDTVLMQFGTNDGGNPARGAGELPGLGDETQSVTNRQGQPEMLHTYGWYMRHLIQESLARGATPIVCSLIPRKIWDEAGHIKRNRDTFEGWAAELARSEKVGFIDLNELIARRLDALGKAEVNRLYVPNPTPANPRGETVHPGWDGAVINAEVVVSGLKALPEDPVAGYFSERARSIAPATP